MTSTTGTPIQAIPAIDLVSAFEHEPPELDFVLPGFLAGTVGALVAPGASGKSYFTLEAAIDIACSVAGADLLGLQPSPHGPVVYFAAEDPAPVLVRRLHAIGSRLIPEARAAVAENLTLVPILGAMLNVMDKRQRASIIARCNGARLIVLDTLSRIHMLDENSNGDMAQLIAVLEHIAVKTNASVLFLHHSSKLAAREEQVDQQQAARGASALIDNARWSGFVAKMTEKEAARFGLREDFRSRFMRFGISKQNYTAQPEERWYERHDGGVLLPADLSARPRGGWHD